MEDIARKAKNEYMREWRRKNKDKVKESHNRYWNKKAKQITSVQNAV